MVRGSLFLTLGPWSSVVGPRSAVSSHSRPRSAQTIRCCWAPPLQTPPVNVSLAGEMACARQVDSTLHRQIGHILLRPRSAAGRIIGRYCPVHDAEGQEQGAESRESPEQGVGSRESGVRSRADVIREQGARSRTLVAERWEPGTGSQEPGAKCHEPEAGSQAFGSREPGIWGAGSWELSAESQECTFTKVTPTSFIRGVVDDVTRHQLGVG